MDKPELKELDRLRLERLNLSISNLNLQKALLIAPIEKQLLALQKEIGTFNVEREKLVKEIMESSDYVAGNMESTDCVSGKWRLNPDTLEFEAQHPSPLRGEGKGEGEVGLAPAQKKEGG